MRKQPASPSPWSAFSDEARTHSQEWLCTSKNQGAARQEMLRQSEFCWVALPRARRGGIAARLESEPCATSLHAALFTDRTEGRQTYITGPRHAGRIISPFIIPHSWFIIVRMNDELKSRPPENPYIEFLHVYKAFDELSVLDDVSFDVRRGEMVAILGRSGVGKSVTLKHILGFLKPDAGQVLVAGREVSALSEDELMEVRRHVTMVFQSGALFDSLTVGENVAYPLRERALRGLAMSEDEIQQRVDNLLAQVELDGMRELMPSDLSTGMKRAVAIARALAAEPECILYDEPTTMVDPLMAQTLGDLILKVKQQTGLTSVVVTHDMKLARKLADRVVFLVDGRVAFFGTIPEMDQSTVPMVQDFIQLDEVSFLRS